jgi:hypothetical protein
MEIPSPVGQSPALPRVGCRYPSSPCSVASAPRPGVGRWARPARRGTGGPGRVGDLKAIPRSMEYIYVSCIYYICICVCVRVCILYMYMYVYIMIFMCVWYNKYTYIYICDYMSVSVWWHNGHWSNKHDGLMEFTQQSLTYLTCLLGS